MHIYEDFSVAGCKTEVEIESACITSAVNFFPLG